MSNIVNKIYEYSLEEIMEKRFADYSKYIIQDRAIPDVRDGLKPVQRRILYSMYEDHNTHDKKFKKSAKAVGATMANYHPHGDTPIYEALVRLSQNWKQNEILVEMDGNNGSMDGDGPAAQRYTECRLAKISNELLGDVNKFRDKRIDFMNNYDDTGIEPTVLPAKFPNLLVNGSTGISAGYATNMAPHNLGEVIDATIKRIDKPDCTLDSILKIIKGPDFPTGGVVEDLDELKRAYETGKGKVRVLCKYEFTKEKGKTKIVINEIPYDVNKALLVKKIDEIRYDKKIDGISEVRDESDKENDLRIVIDLKNGADKELIMNYLLKNTELQTNYNFNNVAIVKKRPRQLGLLAILDAFIEYRAFTMKESCKIDLELYKIQAETEEGLMKAVSILDEVIEIIRSSKNKSDAKENLCKKYDFTEVQAEAIVMLRLYKLTNTDIIAVKENLEFLKEEIKRLTEIINDPEKLNEEIKKDLKEIKKEYARKRRTTISEEITDIKIDKEALIKDEDVIICLTKDGYLKRVSKKSYSEKDDTGLKPGDDILNLLEANTKDKYIIITDLGNYLYSPVSLLPEGKWKDLGKHISNIVTTAPNEKVINSFIINDNTKNLNLMTYTKNGMVKKSNLEAFNVTRYNKLMCAMKLKEDDKVIGASIEEKESIIVSKTGKYVRFLNSEVPLSGVKTGGVKAINLKEDEASFASNILDEEYLCVFTNKNTSKRVKLNELALTGRAKRGNSLMKKNKTVTYHINFGMLLDSKDYVTLKKEDKLTNIKASEINIMDLSSTGMNIKTKYEDAYLKSELKTLQKKQAEDIELPKLNNDVDSAEFKELTIDDFLEEFKL